MYELRDRPIKQAIQKFFAEARKKVLATQNAIVLAGNEVKKQLEMYNGDILSVEKHKGMYAWQQSELHQSRSSRILLCNADIHKLLATEPELISTYNVLDLDLMSSIVTSSDQALRHLQSSISNFVRYSHGHTKFVVVTVCLDPRSAAKFFNQAPTGKHIWEAANTQDRFRLLRSLSMSRIAKICRTVPGLKFHLVGKCVKAEEIAREKNGVYVYDSDMFQGHHYREAFTGPGRVHMLTCQLIHKPQ